MSGEMPVHLKIALADYPQCDKRTQRAPGIVERCAKPSEWGVRCNHCGATSLLCEDHAALVQNLDVPPPPVRLVSVEEVLRLFVPGTPVPQGSKKAYVVGKRAVIVDDNAAVLKPWRAAVKAAAVEAWAGRPAMRDEALVVTADFRLIRPKTVRRPRPHVKPDVDKYLRAVLDALTDAAVWGDDGQVVKAVPEKNYADEAGVLIRVGRYINEKGTTR
jgi:Holliday junction resolvase RusA-like endonuclease